MQHDTIARLQRIRDRVVDAPSEAAIWSLSMVATELRRAAPLVAAASDGTGIAAWIAAKGDPPEDVLEWGADVARYLLHATGGPSKAQWRHALREHLLRDFERIYKLNERTAFSDLALHTFIDPILEWAAVVLGALPGFSSTVRRWTVRVEAFGMPDLPTREEATGGARVPNERAFQLDLARFLFDQGFNLADVERETVVRDRPGQGARVDFMLRDGRSVAVELVLVRAGDGSSVVANHFVQLADYLRTASSTHGMLVVVNVDTQRGVRIAPIEATSSAGLPFGEGRILLEVADVYRPAASAAGRRPMLDVHLPVG